MKEAFIKLGTELVIGTIYANSIFIAMGTTFYIQSRLWSKLNIIEKDDIK
jgi:hypothetical protein